MIRDCGDSPLAMGEAGEADEFMQGCYHGQYTLKGKVTVTNFLLVSMFVYKESTSRKYRTFIHKWEIQ